VICTTKGSNPPTKRYAGGGGGTYQAPPTTVPGGGGTTTTTEPATASVMGSGTWAMIGGGLLAVGLAVVGKKKGWF